MDPEPERSVDVVDDDKSLLSYKTEPPLSEASDVSLPSARRHWMDTRLRTKLRAGGSRLHYQQFDYSTSGTDNELSDVMLPLPPDPVGADQMEPGLPMSSSDLSISPTQRLPQLFSDHERARSPSPQVSSTAKQPSLPGTSAPLVTNPSLTDFLSNYPIWPTAPSIPMKSSSSESGDQSKAPSVPPLLDKGSTRVHLPILDPERPAFSLVNLYHTLTDMFEGTGIHVVLHNRVYVSILSVGLE